MNKKQVKISMFNSLLILFPVENKFGMSYWRLGMSGIDIIF